MKPFESSRRRFMGQASCAAVSSIPLLNTLVNLRLAGSIANAAPPANGEYRALVCLFMSGGNDSFNMLTPCGGESSTHADSHAEYLSSRGNLGLAKEVLHEIQPLNTGGRTFGVHPAMPNLAARFQAGDAAFVANVGTLIEPVQNRLQVAAASKRLPLGLYSHSDQIEQWQTSVPHSRSGIGWAGRMMDLIKDINPGQLVSMNISTDGSNVFQSGTSGAEYAVHPVEGAVPLTGYSAGYSGNGFSDAASSAVDGLLARRYGNLLQETFQKKRRDAQDAHALYSAATSGELPGNIVFPETSLGRQLRQVAKAIMGRNGLGALRQTFFVNRGGWDHHSDTLAMQQVMLGEVDDALGAFWDQIVALGIEAGVTLFSGSDFGRTLTSNDRGSDHAWGGNHFVLGGGVDGRKIFGPYPSLALNPESGIGPNPLDTGRGRLIPTVSCDEYFGELALWLGVQASSLPLILPNIGNFIPSGGSFVPLGFLGDPQVPQNTVPPEVGYEDGAFSVHPGSWAGGATGHTYAWYVNGAIRENETGFVFAGNLATGDELSAVITAINQAGSATAVSNTVIVQAPETAGVALYWNDASDNETGFRFEWGTDGEVFSNVVEIPAHATQSVIRFPGAGIYHGRVRAYNSAGESLPSNTLFDSRGSMIGDIVAIRIAPEGWYAEFHIEGFPTGAAYDFAFQDITVPTERTPYFIVVSEGFDATGAPATVTRKIHATIQQRRADPNESQNLESISNGNLVFQAVLSEFIYNDDKDGGNGTSGVDPVFHAPAGWVRSGGQSSNAVVAGPVSNLSTLDYPVPIANWTRPDYEQLTDYSVTTAAIGFHASGRGGRPLACVEFLAVSGAHSTTVIVPEPRIDSTLADAHPVIEYIATLDLTGFPDNSQVDVNFRAYPWIGDEDSIYDSTAGSATAAINHHTFPQTYLLDVAGVRGYPIAVVNPATGNANGMVAGTDNEANRTAAAAAPYQTLARAMAGLSAYLETFHGRNDLAGATIYLDSGTHRTAGGADAAEVPVIDGNCWFTIKPLPGVTDAVLIPDAGSNQRLAAHAIKFENCVFVRAVNKPFAAGNGGRLLTLACDVRDTRATTSSEEIFDNPGMQWHVRSKFRRVQLFTSYFRGCSFPEGDRLGRRCFIVGCDWSRYGSPSKTFLPSTEPSNTSDGMVMAFNAFWDCNRGIAEYPGISEGTFLQGCAVVQNVFEQANGEGERLMRMAGDGNENVTNNCVVAHNTAVGELSNFFYNDEPGPRHLHNGHVLILNAMRSLGSKGDTFAGDSRATGNWPVYNGCGLRGNRVQGGNFPTRFRGIHSIAGAGDPGDATFLSLGFIHDASASGTGQGHGNYRPAQGSILNAVPGPIMLRWDFDGRERAETDAAGAYRHDSSAYPPAPPAALRLTPHVSILEENFESGGEPAGWTHDSSGYNYDHTATPLRGRRSLWIGGSSSEVPRGVYTPADGGFPRFGEIWSLYLIFKILVMPAGGTGRLLSILRAMDQRSQVFLSIDPSGRLSAGSDLGAGSAGFYPLLAGVETHLWLRVNADGSLSGWAAPMAVKPADVAFTAPGGNLGKTGSIHLGVSRSMQILVDHFRLRTGEIGSDPD